METGQTKKSRSLAPTVESIGSLARFAEVSRQQVKDIAVLALRDLPGVGKVVDKPRTQPLKSSHTQLGRWVKSGYGTPEKPAELGEIPWDYVEENEDEIPFLGLREYWYPAIESRELHNNEPKAVVMLGDRIVLFRDGDGEARALENRCPHRGPLLSLGMVGVTEPGTITCRYHGMTFDGDGECTAFLADGPDSPACGKVRARSYPTEELGGIVWIYMGEKEPEPVKESVAHADEVFDDNPIFVHRMEYPFNHLNTVDNNIDLVHPSVLHRTCVPFSGQKPYGRVKTTEPECGGLLAKFVDDEPHSGSMHIDQIEWHLPNFAYHQPGDMGDVGFGYNWSVPQDIGSSSLWLILAQPGKSPLKQKLMKPVESLLFGFSVPYPGSLQTCIDAADTSMMASQGRVARWDLDDLSRTDGPVVKARRMLKKAYTEERVGSASSGAPDPRSRANATNATNGIPKGVPNGGQSNGHGELTEEHPAGGRS